MPLDLLRWRGGTLGHAPGGELPPVRPISRTQRRSSCAGTCTRWRRVLVEGWHGCARSHRRSAGRRSSHHVPSGAPHSPPAAAPLAAPPLVSWTAAAYPCRSAGSRRCSKRRTRSAVAGGSAAPAMASTGRMWTRTRARKAHCAVCPHRAMARGAALRPRAAPQQPPSGCRGSRPPARPTRCVGATTPGTAVNRPAAGSKSRLAQICAALLGTGGCSILHGSSGRTEHRTTCGGNELPSPGDLWQPQARKGLLSCRVVLHIEPAAPTQCF